MCSFARAVPARWMAYLSRAMVWEQKSALEFSAVFSSIQHLQNPLAVSDYAVLLIFYGVNLSVLSWCTTYMPFENAIDVLNFGETGA